MKRFCNHQAAVQVATFTRTWEQHQTTAHVLVNVAEFDNYLSNNELDSELYLGSLLSD